MHGHHRYGAFSNDPCGDIAHQGLFQFSMTVGAHYHQIKAPLPGTFDDLLHRFADFYHDIFQGQGAKWNLSDHCASGFTYSVSDGALCLCDAGAVKCIPFFAPDMFHKIYACACGKFFEQVRNDVKDGHFRLIAVSKAARIFDGMPRRVGQVGYIIGLKYAAIITAGSMVGWFVIIPIINYFAPGMTIPVGSNAVSIIGAMSAEELFSFYVRPIGIGGIAMAGVIGIIRSSSIIKKAFGLAITETFSRKSSASKEELRTRRDLPMAVIGGGIILTAILIFVFFQFGVVHNLTHALIGLAIVMVIAFLFTTVAANAIAIVGTNPVSGMTLMTLIISSLILASVGLTGTTGMVAALVIGGVVCTALSMAGGFITDLKIGYWLGSSPYKQQRWKFLGTLVSAATVGGVIIILNKTYGFTGEGALVAPQANAMAAVIEPMMSGKPAPWLLYGAGAFLSLILTMIGVPALAFALGMFIPLQLNTPLLVGGIIAHIVSNRSKNSLLNKARRERGTLIASGFIAGGALMGVISAVLKFFDINYVNKEWFESNSAEIIAIVMFAILCGYMIWESLRAKPEEE